MHRIVNFGGLDLTRHIAKPAMFLGRTLQGWFWVYTFFAILLFVMCLVYVRYLELFDSIEQQSQAYQDFVLLFSGIPILILLPAIAGLLWWASGFLMRYSRWQVRQPGLWRPFWIVVLLFYGVVELDVMDVIHPQMSHKGLGMAPDLLAMFEPGYSLSQGIPMVRFFQWGYFLLWVLFWFLIAVLHWQYLLDGLREAWFYIQRFHRYGASVLTGFRETARAAGRAPVPADYPAVRPVLPPVFRGVPRLNVAELSEADAARIIAADVSGAITAAPGQPTVLFVDLGRYDHGPELTDLTDGEGTPLVRFADWWGRPGTVREDLVIPLRPVQGEPVPAVPGGTEVGVVTPVEPNEDITADNEPGETVGRETVDDGDTPGPPDGEAEQC